MSRPVTWLRRTGSLMQTARVRRVPVQRWPGSGMPCSTRNTGAAPLSHIAALNAVTCTTGMSPRSAIGCRQPAASPRGVLCSRYTAGRWVQAKAVQRGPVSCAALPHAESAGLPDAGSLDGFGGPSQVRAAETVRTVPGVGTASLAAGTRAVGRTFSAASPASRTRAADGRRPDRGERPDGRDDLRRGHEGC